MADATKFVYLFKEGNRDMKELLGGKGANLAEMTRQGIPVPSGFTITTEVCNKYYQTGNTFPQGLEEQVRNAVKDLEAGTGMSFGNPKNPLLLSVRSGARVSMPGMMDTVLKLGINEEVVRGLIEKTGDERFAWDSYRRFIQMYGDVVLGLKPQSKDEEDPFEIIMDRMKKERDIQLDTQLTAGDLEELSSKFKDLVRENLGLSFPEDPWEQLWGAVGAVFRSWMNDRAKTYRRINDIPSDWGTAVNVQAMVFGNMGEDCATGVAFTRDPATGENIFFGEYLTNAQGEDVVAGVRTPYQITLEGSRRWAASNRIDEEERYRVFPSLEERMPRQYQELVSVYRKLEQHYADMQDIEFTIQNGKLWLLQTRNGKRTAAAAIKIAVDMVDEGLIDKRKAVSRIKPEQLDQLLHPTFDPHVTRETIARGLPASPGAASGKIVFNAEDAEERSNAGEKVILSRIETSPEDIGGMKSAQGILTSRGGMTSHAAVVARGMGKCCVSGCGALKIDYERRTIKVGELVLLEGDWISLDGSTGEVMLGKIPTIPPEIGGDFAMLLSWADEIRRLGVRTNADTPIDSVRAREFGAEGIGLCRTEHMFFEGDRITAMREMILAKDIEGRQKALSKLLPMQREDFIGIFQAMEGYPVTIRLLDPPLHEFLPHDADSQSQMSRELGISIDEVRSRTDALREFNPMLGHRGCRLGITFPEITRMQAEAIFEAAVHLVKEGRDVRPEIMVPLVGTVRELELQKDIIDETAGEVMERSAIHVDYLVGTMIEVPRAALTADEIAQVAQFFSFGTNDLTQMTFGYSRDDSGSFLPEYIQKGILPGDPFKMLDQTGVGQLLEIGTRKGRSVDPKLKVGICGEHGGDPSSIEFCNRTGLDYVSCSPFRVPVARLAAAHAVLNENKV
ncbi:MAG: pyruvate, phosphate dikinase [Candidatus Thermoplasmatota archaeon]|nr:pyruvate, phosphate dikinase [Candidatus Thermoplasmatota archaeon]